jgi:transcriptional regulator
MYIPAPFAETRIDVLHAQMREHSFATVVSFGEAGLVASHLPLLLDPDRGPSGTIVGHLARANPQWPRKVLQPPRLFPRQLRRTRRRLLAACVAEAGEVDFGDAL